MPIKTKVKKTVKNSRQTKTLKTRKKPVKKAPKKVTWDDLEANFARIQKTQDEAWAEASLWRARERRECRAGLFYTFDA
ncbi:hypothetical protein, partial [Treponema sp. R6D11]